MNLKVINNSIGKLLQVLAILMSVPLLVSFIYRESLADKMYFVIPIALCLIVGTLLVKFSNDNGHIYNREGMFTTAFCWVLYSAIGAIPLFLTPSNYPTFLDAFFEMASGFTTCGASVANNVENLTNSIIFWRSFSHLIGGMGILVFTLAILPKQHKESANLMQAEVPGPTFGKITPKLVHTARALYILYLSLTAITALALKIAGMNVFDSIIYAMGTAGTGGFGNRGLSIGFYDSRAIEIILSIGMLLFGVNFNLYYYAIYRSAKDSFKSEELKWYLIIILAATLLIFINILPQNQDVFHSGVSSFFTVTSTITTTGYVSLDYSKWPLFSRNILILLMFVGGCAGSTAGGIKVSRITMLVKTGINRVKQAINPMRITVNKLDGKKVDKDIEHYVNKYLIVYILLFIIFMFAVTLDTNDLETAFTAVATTFNNVGPGLGQFGPITSFENIGNLSKFVLSFAMLFGRLELYPMILLFSPRSYKKLRNK